MKRHARKAFTALKKMGAPVFIHPERPGHFHISGESNGDETWADYYNAPRLERIDSDTGEISWAFGVNPKIERVLKANKLMCEWENASCLVVGDK